MKWYLHALKNTFNYQGRARRAEFGWFYLTNFFIQMAMLIVVWLVAFVPMMSTLQPGYTQDSAVGPFGIGALILLIIYFVYGTVVTLTVFSLTARRLHDLGKSGWWQLLIYCLPIIYAIIALAIGMTIAPMNSYTLNDSTMISSMTFMLIGNAFIVLVTFGFLALLLFKDGQRFENKYGADPKAAELTELLQTAQKLQQSSEKIENISQKM